LLNVKLVVHHVTSRVQKVKLKIKGRREVTER